MNPGAGIVCVMLKFPASLAARIGTCNLDWTNDNDIQLFWTLDLLLVLQRRRTGEESSVLSVTTTVVAVEGPNWLHWVGFWAWLPLSHFKKLSWRSMWGLSSPTGIEPAPLALEVWHCNHWIAREVSWAWFLSPGVGLFYFSFFSIKGLILNISGSVGHTVFVRANQSCL